MGTSFGKNGGPSSLGAGPATASQGSSQQSLHSTDTTNLQQIKNAFRTGSTTSLYNISTNNSCALQILIYGDYNRMNRKTILGCIKIDLKQVQFNKNNNQIRSKY